MLYIEVACGAEHRSTPHCTQQLWALLSYGPQYEHKEATQASRLIARAALFACLRLPPLSPLPRSLQQLPQCSVPESCAPHLQTLQMPRTQQRRQHGGHIWRVTATACAASCA